MAVSLEEDFGSFDARLGQRTRDDRRDELFPGGVDILILVYAKDPYLLALQLDTEGHTDLLSQAVRGKSDTMCKKEEEGRRKKKEEGKEGKEVEEARGSTHHFPPTHPVALTMFSICAVPCDVASSIWSCLLLLPGVRLIGIFSS